MTKKPDLKTKGRGAVSNTTGRFEKLQQEADFTDYGYLDPEEVSLLTTQVLTDTSRTVINKNDSPDIGFNFSVNIYRGCEHGCIYCFARPTHEYLGFSAGLDFESKIFVKHDAPVLLKKELMAKSWKGEVIAMSGVTDCYQPAERKFQLTRQCLEILAEFRNPVVIITKNQLVRRDIDILQKLAAFNAIRVCVSVTSLDDDLARILEPRTSSPQARLKTIEELSKAGIPVTALMAPIIPGLTDHEIPAVLEAVSQAGAISAGFTPVRLPYSVKDLFSEWLETHFPDRKEKVLNHIRQMRGGKLNDSNFGSRMRGEGPIVENMNHLFDVFTRKFGLNKKKSPLTSEHFKKPSDQMELF